MRVTNNRHNEIESTIQELKRTDEMTLNSFSCCCRHHHHIVDTDASRR